MTEPIATIDFQREGKRYTAALGSDMRWTVPDDADLADVLNALFPVDQSPSAGSPGRREGHKAAEWLRGTVHFPPRKPAPPGVDF